MAQSLMLTVPPEAAMPPPCETERNVSYINGALWWALQFETGARAHSLRDETKTQTSVTPAGRCGGPLVQNWQETHISGSILVNAGQGDCHDSAGPFDDNTAALLPNWATQC